MTRISSGDGFSYRRVVRLVSFGIVSLVEVGFIVALLMGQDVPLVVLLGPPAMAAALLLVQRWLFAGLVDEVFDAGDALIVRKGEIEERVPLNNILDVQHRPLTRPPQVQVILTEGVGSLGIGFSFVAPFKLTVFSKPAAIEDLIQRVQNARAG